MPRVGAVGARGSIPGDYDIVLHTAGESKGNLYPAEIVNQRRAQKFVPKSAQ